MKYFTWVELGILIGIALGISAVFAIVAAVLAAKAIGFLMAVSWDQFLTTCAERFHRC